MTINWMYSLTQSVGRWASHRRLLVLAVFGLILSSPTAAQTSARRLAVLEFQGKKVDTETLTTFADAVRSGAPEALTRTGVGWLFTPGRRLGESRPWYH